LSAWCEQNAQLGHPDEWTTARNKLGVLYNVLLKNDATTSETLPKKLILKNYLRIKDYYLYTPVQESQEDDPRGGGAVRGGARVGGGGGNLILLVIPPHWHINFRSLGGDG
ncbi:MAG: hypothetical protein LUE13_12025, partial [Akkermansiaceae bacterium]|nr:hypothetical protein [Akkermansiaceae bacterium]